MAAAPQAAMAGRQPVNAAAVEDPLLGDQEANYPQADNNGGSSFPWPTILGFLILSFNAAMAIIRSQGEKMAIAFVGFSYAVLAALFVCLRMYERARAGSSKREWLKIAVWTLTTLLTFSFSYKVAAIMPAPVAVVVWLMAFTTVAGGFVAFFVYKEKANTYVVFIPLYWRKLLYRKSSIVRTIYGIAKPEGGNIRF